MRVRIMIAGVLREKSPQAFPFGRPVDGQSIWPRVSVMMHRTVFQGRHLEIEQSFQAQTQVPVRATGEILIKSADFEQARKPQEEIRSLDVGILDEYLIGQKRRGNLLPAACVTWAIVSDEAGNDHVGGGSHDAAGTLIQVLRTPRIVIVQDGDVPLVGFTAIAAAQLINAAIPCTRGRFPGAPIAEDNDGRQRCGARPYPFGNSPGFLLSRPAEIRIHNENNRIGLTLLQPDRPQSALFEKIEPARSGD
jgi:hypothetical protein